MQAAIVADIAAATDAADAHATSRPDASCPAAASAARSAAACARCRAITAEPTTAPPTVSASSTAIIAAATTLAEPRSDPGSTAATASAVIVMPGNRVDRELTLRDHERRRRGAATSSAPAGPTLRTASEAAPWSPRAANRAASRAASTHRTCIPTAASPPTHSTRTDRQRRDGERRLDGDATRVAHRRSDVGVQRPGDDVGQRTHDRVAR